MAYFGRVLRNYSDMAFGTVTEYGKTLTEVPRLKFQFVVEFKTTLGIGGGDKNYREMIKDLSLVVQSVELPSFQFDTQTLNQYNRKRIIQTKMNWNPISISFHDTRDNKWLNVWKEYMKFHYKDGREKYSNFGAGNLTPDIVENSPNIDEFGFQTPFSKTSIANPDLTNVNSQPGDSQGSLEPEEQMGAGLGAKERAEGYEYEKYYFSQIKIYKQFGGRNGPIADPITLYNPVILSVNNDSLSYADSSPVQWSVQFGFEGVSYDKPVVPKNSYTSMWSRAQDEVTSWFGDDGSQSGETPVGGGSLVEDNFGAGDPEVL